MSRRSALEATAAAIMWNHDSGSVPVLEPDGKLVGIVTDRDICIAVATRRRLASEIPVNEVMSGRVVACKFGDSVKEALRKMREAQIRRIPILDEAGRLKGIVSVADIIQAVRELKAQAPREALMQEIILTLMAISQRQAPHALQLAGVQAMVPGA